MAKALDDHGLESNFCRLESRQITQEMIALIRGSPPSHNPHGNKDNIRVWYPSKKMSGIIKAESRRVEFPWVMEAEYDDDVLEYFDQPLLSCGVNGDLLKEFLDPE
jgi:putative transposase